MTFADIKTLLSYLYGPYVGKGFINTTSGSVTEVAYLLQLVHDRIASYPNEWEFLKETGSITLTGASTYNLRSSFADLRSVYQIYGINSNQDHPFLPNFEANITPATGYSLRDATLIFTGNIPGSGTMTIQYKSAYMVKSAGGTRKLNFTADDDYSVLLDNDINVLIFGVGEYINWKSDVVSQERRREIKEWFKEAFTNLLLLNANTNQSISML